MIPTGQELLRRLRDTYVPVLVATLTVHFLTFYHTWKMVCFYSGKKIILEMVVDDVLERNFDVCIF